MKEIINIHWVLETELWNGLRYQRNGKSRRQPKSPLLSLPCRHPTLCLRNVMDHLPEDQKDQVKSAMRAAWRLDTKTGLGLRKLAEWLEREYPSAAASLMEGMEECFTINRLDVHLRCILPGHHQYHRESPCRRSHADSESMRLARHRHGETLDSVGSSGDREELPEDHGLSHLWALDAILNGSNGFQHHARFGVNRHRGGLSRRRPRIFLRQFRQPEIQKF
jgi:hypothetical protein